MGLKNKLKTKKKIKLTRKELRKGKRKEKKARRNQYNTKRGQALADSKSEQEISTKSKEKPEKKTVRDVKVQNKSSVLSTEEQHRKEKREQKKIQKGMSKQRREQLLKANMQEDKTIRKMEKQLKLHKRKTKAIPKSFVADGLDYLLEACDSEYMKTVVAAEQDLLAANDEFEEDFALMTGQGTKSNKNKTGKKVINVEREESDDFEDVLNENDYSEEDDSEGQALSENDDIYDSNENLDTDSENEGKTKLPKKNTKQEKKSRKRKENERGETDTESENEMLDKFDSESDSGTQETVSINSAQKGVASEKVMVNKKRKLNSDTIDEKQNDKRRKTAHLDNSESENEDDSEFSGVGEESESDTDDAKNKQEKGEVWEDIYGRLRSKDGTVINNSEGKYIPPAVRAKMESSGSEDQKRKEKLDRLRKQLKGLLNRLAESNMHNIAGQIETLYMNNSRNDMNETLNTLIFDSLISNVLTPERLLMEHVLLMTVLHANVGTEVGANFLQTIIKKFDRLSKTTQNVEDKSLDNVVNILAQLYNFKVFDAKLLYEILQRLTYRFDEKNVECILHVLKSVGFGLRKDDPIALKTLILELQKQAASASEGKVSNSRVKFLLDILLAIKNNNVTKIPNYDTTYSEHLKKIMKGFVRKGNYVTPLNISLEDLLKADERGKWWVVGSAWTGNIETSEKKEKSVKGDVFSQKLLDLARKQRMNTDTRRDIFCIIMSAEDYLDAFEKLLRLGLKNQQEREIIHVILNCCLQEKEYNPYYAVLAQKFCEYDRKYQMTIKYSVWDKLKSLNNHSGGQISNLAKLLTYLFIEKGLPISTLKIVEFSELDKITLRFMRQILLGILLHNDLEAVQGVFEKVAQSDKLKVFRESLRLFIHHFLLKNLKTESVPEDQKNNLRDRAKIIEKILIAKDSKIRL